MTQTKYEFTGLSTREGFNRSLRHFRLVGEVVGDFESRHNLADILNSLHEAKRLEANQVAPVVNALCVGHPKYSYLSRSHNLTRNVEDSAPIAAAVGKWNGVDLLLAYYHPDLGLTLINPKNPQHWEAAGALKKNELVTVYAGTFQEKAPQKLLEEALEAMIGWLEGRKPKASPALLKGKFKHRPVRVQAAPEAAPAEARAARGRPARAALRPATGPQERFAARAVAARASAGPAPAGPAAAPARLAKRRMTPMYSIPVTNELFHNGNVEAWKRIIQSYNHKYPGTEVFVFYEGERIHDINTLFKWGKVKHGSSIMIAVAGDTIQDVAKLQRYLRQGASPAFEAFLRFPVNTILNLF
jgi:hypothetical protein